MCQCISCLRNESPFCFTCFVFVFFLLFFLLHHNIDLCSTVMLNRMAFNLNAAQYKFLMRAPRGIPYFTPISADTKWPKLVKGRKCLQQSVSTCTHFTTANVTNFCQHCHCTLARTLARSLSIFSPLTLYSTRYIVLILF